jgi:hypothetical protein
MYLGSVAAFTWPDAAAATADNIRASATLFRVSFVVDLTANLVYLPTAMALYLLFRHVHGLVAAATVTFVAVSVAVGSLNLLSQYTALTIATSDAYARGLGKSGADALALLFADMVRNGNTLNAIWYGPWLVPLGYLVIKPRPGRPSGYRLGSPGRRRHRGGSVHRVAGGQGRPPPRSSGMTARFIGQPRGAASARGRP